MTQFLAFLRGINVGGRTVKKEILQQAFETLGFRNIITYKTSGNIIFETYIADREELKNKITKT
jgi:uncharacterized protein (DUF1697 family)